MSESEFFSTNVKAGNRTYFLDVKQTELGDGYLKITESKRRGEADYSRNHVLVFEEDIEKFLIGLLGASSAFGVPEERLRSSSCAAGG